MLKIDYQVISPSGLSTTRVVVIGESLWQWSIMIDAAVEKVASINGERVWKETRKSFHLCLSSLHLKLEPLLTLPFFCCSTTIVKFSCFSITIISILTFFTITLFLFPSNVGPPPKESMYAWAPNKLLLHCSVITHILNVVLTSIC